MKHLFFASIIFVGLSAFADGPASGLFPTGTGVFNQNSIRGQCVKGEVKVINSSVAGIGNGNTSSLGVEIALFGNSLFHTSGLRTELDDSPESSFYRASKSKLNSNEVTVSVPAEYKFSNEMLTEPELTEYGKAAKAAKRWKHDCGDQVVDQRSIGTDLFVAIKLEVMDANESGFYGCDASEPAREALSLISLSKMDQNSQKNFSQLCPSAQITVAVLQRGGAPDLIPSPLIQRSLQGNRAFATISCSAADIKPCIAAASNLTGYAYSPSGFISQIKDQSQVGSRGGPAVIDYFLTNYTSFGIFE